MFDGWSSLDPKSARDVFAFVLAPAECFAGHASVNGLLEAESMVLYAKVLAISRWRYLNRR
jgi:hypothetical protein